MLAPGGTGSLSALVTGDPGSLNGGSSFDFGSCTQGTSCALAINDFITFSGVTFDLTSLTFNRYNYGGGNGAINFYTGIGTVCVTGQGCGGGQAVFSITKTGLSWSGSGTLSGAIPEPPTLALLGAALVGFGVLRFRRKKLV